MISKQVYQDFEMLDCKYPQLTSQTCKTRKNTRKVTSTDGY